MLLEASCSFEMRADYPVTSIFMLRARSGMAQVVTEEAFITTPYVPITEYVDSYGNLCQRIIVPAGHFKLESSVKADCEPAIDVNIWAPYTPVEEVPDTILQFLLPSRYCESDKMNDLAASITKGALPGYPQVEAIRHWIYTHLSYQYGITNSSTSALDIITSRTGVCRDYAHLGIALCRNLDIPARMVVGYLCDLKPMDLHAWFEAYVGNRWYTFDATQAEPKGKRIAMAYGRDATDVAFATHFGIVDLISMEVQVREL
jgi:transglutaminase-like putative cysteine protease